MLSVLRLGLAGLLAFASPVPDRQQWVFDALGVERAWTLTQGEGVTVAVVGSAVDTRLKELRGRVTVGPDMAGSTLNREVKPGAHGTAMAALIAGAGGDGLSGVAPKARVLSLPVPERVQAGPLAEPPNPGGETPLARAIRYAANHGADVVSVPTASYGVNRSEREAVSYALGKGVVLVAAAGDDGMGAYARDKGTSYWSFPAGYPGVIGVAAVDRQGRTAPFSSDNLSVLVGAPGVDVPVVELGGVRELSTGTGTAAALVAGVAALIKAEHPKLAPWQVAQALTTGARGRPAAGYDERSGFGTVDAAAALDAAARLAGKRRELAVPGDRHFGAGESAGKPAPPGPDPWRLLLYGTGVILALVTFCGAIIALNPRKR
ncbi:S8 family serine peptidase [Nonomuraea longicatena]|uniref:Type VII secretion-associated serine protease mycosin n=1 Tax=Nonomuraea longicatena TaxID=83682 RepID=A0ABN1R171_9ACTN